MVYRPRNTRWQYKKILLLHSFCALKNNYCQHQTLWYRQHRLLARPPPTPSPIRNSHERLPAPGPPTSTPHTDDHRRAHLPASDFIRVQQLLNSILEPSQKTPHRHTETQKQTEIRISGNGSLIKEINERNRKKLKRNFENPENTGLGRYMED